MVALVAFDRKILEQCREELFKDEGEWERYKEVSPIYRFRFHAEIVGQEGAIINIRCWFEDLFCPSGRYFETEIIEAPIENLKFVILPQEYAKKVFRMIIEDLLYPEYFQSEDRPGPLPAFVVNSWFSESQYLT